MEQYVTAEELNDLIGRASSQLSNGALQFETMDFELKETRLFELFAKESGKVQFCNSMHHAYYNIKIGRALGWQEVTLFLDFLEFLLPLHRQAEQQFETGFGINPSQQGFIPFSVTDLSMKQVDTFLTAYETGFWMNANSNSLIGIGLAKVAYSSLARAGTIPGMPQLTVASRAIRTVEDYLFTDAKRSDLEIETLTNIAMALCTTEMHSDIFEVWKFVMLEDIALGMRIDEGDGFFYEHFDEELFCEEKESLRRSVQRISISDPVAFHT